VCGIVLFRTIIVLLRACRGCSDCWHLLYLCCICYTDLYQSLICGPNNKVKGEERRKERERRRGKEEELTAPSPLRVCFFFFLLFLSRFHLLEAQHLSQKKL
jgi:hypothetical protein